MTLYLCDPVSGVAGDASYGAARARAAVSARTAEHSRDGWICDGIASSLIVAEKVWWGVKTRRRVVVLARQTTFML